MFKSNKNIIILVFLLVFLLIFIFYFFILRDNKNEDFSELVSCEEIRAEINSEIEDLRYCKTANDCVLLNSCVYGCNNLINKNADMTALVQLEARFVESCGDTCEEQCSGALKASEIKCENRKCVGTRK
ncbi:hypothetical protein C0583_04725 [Candidatus Parcubacteria bacterium]|nr:MAG: hypothetical protein C0583_04725 [Candidatus Parcubacteria bacterium]